MRQISFQGPLQTNNGENYNDHIEATQHIAEQNVSAYWTAGFNCHYRKQHTAMPVRASEPTFLRQGMRFIIMRPHARVSALASPLKE